MSLAPHVLDSPDLDQDVRKWLSHQTNEIKRLSFETVVGAWDIGNILCQAKEKLHHGQFGSWIAESFGWSLSYAEKMMNVSRQWTREQLREKQFSTKALFLLSSPSMPQAARDEALAIAEEGKPVTGTVAEKIAEENKPKKPKAANDKSKGKSERRSDYSEAETEKVHVNGVHQAEVVEDEPAEPPTKPAKPEAPVMTDDSGKTPVPASLAKFFVQRLNFKSATDQLIPRLKEELLIIARGPFSAHIKKFGFKFDEFQKQLDGIHKILRVLCPSKVCQKCNGTGKLGRGEDCGQCEGRGFRGY